MTLRPHMQERDRDIGLIFGGALLFLAVLRPDMPFGTGETPQLSAPGGLPVALPKTVGAAPDPDGGSAGPAPSTAPATEFRGVDVSHYQGAVDWPTVAKAGISFVYAKATEGVTYVDPRFAVNAASAPAAGLRFGAYHFFVPSDDATAQAEHFLSVAAPATGMLPPVLDLEKSAGGSDNLAQNAVTWLAHVKEKTGCTPLVYASPAFYEAHLGDALSDYPLYLADYAKSPKVPTGAGPLVLWQHSQKGTVSGVPGHVDLDRYEARSVSMEAFLCP